MPATITPITFIVSGELQPATSASTRGAAPPRLPAGLSHGSVKRTVRVGARRGSEGVVRIDAVPGEDVVVLDIAGGPSLVLHPDNARALMLAQSANARSRAAGGGAAGDVDVPIQLRWGGEVDVARGATRGLLGDVVLAAFHVITGVSKDSAADFAAGTVVERFDAQVDNGVYSLTPDSLPVLKGVRKRLEQIPSAGDDPLLVLLHGTFSNSSGTFGKLWSEHPQHVRALFTRYKNQIYALDHPTLGASPIENALTLVQCLPEGARLHLVSHSRGGLVAETLARVCANPNVSAHDLAFFPAGSHAVLQDLAKQVKTRGISVDRVVRVACPARGTLLASHRLDAYLSVFKWGLELAGLPVLPELVDFLAAVAQRREDPLQVPGLAAQMPDSPLVKWLHSGEEAIPGQLRVVAGDMEGDSVISWIKTLLADAFYWTDNDLVVQTRSMYGGAPRAQGASFLLDTGGKVSHFKYFSNADSAEAIVNALILDDPPGFRTIGPLSWAGESATGVRGRRGDGKPASDKPAAFVLPGILGSNLKVNGKRIWLSWRLINGLQRLTYVPGAANVEPDGPIDLIYDHLSEFLSDSHEVIEFPFDWRLPLEQEARRLGAAITAALDARAQSGQPVRIVAHSMGGLLARTMELECPAVWARMMTNPGGRLLMLGTPNGGSWAPMQVLSGDDTFGNALVVFGAPFQDHAARDLMAQLPGFIQLQAALRDPAQGLRDQGKWAELAQKDLEAVKQNSLWHSLGLQIGTYTWGVPDQKVLDQAAKLWERLDAQREHGLDAFKSHMALVVGKAAFTPDGYEFGEDGLKYLDALEDGDGRVTLASAMIAGVPTWKVDCDHSNLPRKHSAFEGYLDLLQHGTTTRLDTQVAAGTRGGAPAPPAPHVRQRVGRLRKANRPPESEATVLDVDTLGDVAMEQSPGMAALRITVVNGDLSFVQQPLLIGHYRSLRLTGTENVADRLIGQAMDDSLKVGLYPVMPGTHQVFVNQCARPEDPRQIPRPEAVVVVGLGEEGKLRAEDLVLTVRQATIAWARREAEKGSVAVQFELAATLIASGGSGITVGQSAQLVAQGVREANDRLHEANESLRDAGKNIRSDRRTEIRRWPTVGHLHLTELYLDRASEAWRALRVQAAAAPQQYAITDTVRSAVGPLQRPLDFGYRGADYDFISAVSGEDSNNDAIIQYTLDTKRARSEVRAQAAQGRLVRQLIARASNDGSFSREIGCTLFKLLVPVAMEPFVTSSSEIQIEVDGGTAAIPWELLTPDDDHHDKIPWAIRAKLLRKLRTAEFRPHVQDATPEGSILVIGEPQCDPAIYPRLPGARAEANAVAELLKNPTVSGSVNATAVMPLISPNDPSLFGADAGTIIDALLTCDRAWRIVHIAGHGEPPELIGNEPKAPGDPQQRTGDPRGVVLSDGTFLGPREIANMRVVPELVFINCCHLAARPIAQALQPDDRLLGRPYNRAQFAASVAEELIKIGVRCVIAAGWAVDDGAARVFATTFYSALLNSQRFIDAVALARRAAHAKGGNTWAAYQCYGDPDWTFRPQAADAQRPARSLQDEFGGVASPEGLRLALNTIAVDTRYRLDPNPSSHGKEEQRAKVRYLEARFEALWGDIGSVATAFGDANDAVGNPDAAIRWYTQALAANDGTASLKAAEQLGNLRARRAWGMVANLERRALVATAASTPPRGRKTKRATEASPPAPPQALLDARKEIAEALDLLETLVKVQPSIERLSLCGSAWKRRAMVEGHAGNTREEIDAIAKMKDYYAAAEQLAREHDHAELYYPALNRMAAELIVDATKPGWGKLDEGDIAAVRNSLATKTRDDPDFWSVASLTDLRVYEAIANDKLAPALGNIETAYRDLHARVPAAGMWHSVRDQLEFVLPHYVKRASQTEKQAVKDLLTLLNELIKGGST